MMIIAMRIVIFSVIVPVVVKFPNFRGPFEGVVRVMQGYIRVWVFFGVCVCVCICVGVWWWGGTCIIYRGPLFLDLLRWLIEQSSFAGDSVSFGRWVSRAFWFRIGLPPSCRSLRKNWRTKTMMK